MKKSQPKSAVEPEHLLTHEQEVVIHHPEEDQTDLARWLSGAMQNSTLFWGSVAGIVALAFGSVLLFSWTGKRDASSDQAWTELATLQATEAEPGPLAGAADTALSEKLQSIANKNEKSTAGAWARLQAAAILLNEGSRDLVTSSGRAEAEAKLVEADAIYTELANSSASDLLKRQAALGLARTEEARCGIYDEKDRGSLAKAIELYETVSKNWPNTPEASVATQYAERLSLPSSKAFYEKLASLTPESMGSLIPPPAIGGPGGTLDLPPGGLGGATTSPLLPPDFLKSVTPPAGGTTPAPTTPAPAEPAAPAPSDAPATPAAPTETPAAPPAEPAPANPPGN